MAKRSATSELNHDNWDQEDEPEHPGTITVLSEADLKKRVIKKARRTFINSESPGSGSKPSPFTAFSGFSSNTSSNPFDFLKKNDAKENEESPTNEEKKENGNSVDIKEQKTCHIENSDSEASNITISDKQKPIRSIEYYRQLQSLNESVMKWMQLHLSKNSCCDFTPVFNDYKKHLDTLSVTYPVKSKDNLVEGKTTYFKKSSTSSSTFLKNNTNATSEVKQKHDDETDYGANFKSNTTNTSTFSFGIKRTPTSTSTMSSGHPTTSLKDESSATEKKPFQFSVGFQANQAGGFNKPFSFASAPVERTEDLEAAPEDAEYVPPKNEFVAVKEEDAIYSKRCKLFYKKDDSYIERGVGILHLKPLDGKTQLLIRADTSLGNILLNIILSATLPVSKTGKNNVLLVCVPNPPLDTKNVESKEAIPMLIRVKTSEDADELLETLIKYKS